MKTIICRIKGIAPLLHHRFPVEEHGENKKRGKQKVYIPKEEAEKSTYRDAEGNLYVPAEHIFQSLVRAGTNFIFEGKKTYKDIIKAGVIVEPEQISLAKKEWDEIDARAVVVQRARVVRWRPKFNDWEVEFNLVIINDDEISPSTLKDILDKAGQLGIGDYRPRFGRFQVIKYDEQ